MAGEEFVWGTLADRSFGVVQSDNENDSAEIAEERDHQGKVIVQKAYSVAKERRVNVLIDSEKELPKAGETVTIGGVEYLVSSCEKTGEGEGFQKATIVGTKKDSADLQAIGD